MVAEEEEDEDDDDDDEARREPTAEELDAEARELLQWPELSSQVRSFTATVLGFRACTPFLPLGASPAISARWLSETTACVAACDAGALPTSVFEGTKDVRAFIRGAASGKTLSGASLADIASTMTAAARVWASVESLVATTSDADAAAAAFAPLVSLASPLASTPRDVETEIRRCVAVPGGNVLDDASDALRAIRDARRDAERELRELLRETADYMARKNFAERAQIVTRLNRECIPIKAGAQSEMEGVILGASGSGQTVFKEPAGAVPLNNAIAELNAKEDAEIERVLRTLTALVLGADDGEGLTEAVEALGAVDATRAKAKHAAWLDASPVKVVGGTDGDGDDDDDGGGGGGCVRLPGARHPLLLQRTLPKLPRGGTIGASESTEGWDGEGEGDDDDDEGEGEDDDGEEDEKPSTSSASSVVPIDFVVPPRTSLVAITGPNTGGKTASLKLLGLCLLMARAGLHLPVARGAAGADARVPWTKTVLADLGDAQSLDLEGGLSTFSAHLRRLQRILRASRDDTDAKRYTVVLLDEPGGGTDPAEGAALASAVLRASADACRLVVATSHYDEVKALAGGDGGDGGMVGAANAAVEFDAATLRPTYRLLWGASGESNALAIARGLGLDAGVADRAEKRWRRQRRAAGLRGDDDDGAGAATVTAVDDVSELASALERERASQEERAASAAAALTRAEALHDDVFLRGAKHLRLREEICVETAERRGVEAMRDAETTLALAETREELEAFASEALPRGWTFDARGEAVPGEKNRDGGGDGDGDAGDGADGRGWTPKVGSVVIVRRLGGAEAEVLDVDEGAREVLVKFGSITTRVLLAEVSRVA